MGVTSVLGGIAPALRPGLRAVRLGDGGSVRGDLLAGLTVAAYLVPQVLAYAQVAGLPAVAGLWASIGALTLYALIGSSRLLSVGPESTTALMTATAIAPLAFGDVDRYAVLAAALALIVGGICLLARVARLGFIADVLSRPVLVGYMAGIALVMIAGQLGRTTGIPAEGDTVVGQVISFAGHLDRAHLPTIVLAAAPRRAGGHGRHHDPVPGQDRDRGRGRRPRRDPRPGPSRCERCRPRDAAPARAGGGDGRLLRQHADRARVRCP
jgi:SulP family sulfate permease